MKLDPYFTLYIKINSKWIKDLNVRPNAVKLLEENIGKKLQDIGFDNYFLDMTSKNIGNKSKNRQMELCQSSKLLCLKGNNQQSEKSTYRKGRKYLQIIYLIRG